MYDPLIVDTFIDVHKQIAPETLPLGPPRDALDEITSSTLVSSALSAPTFGLEDITASGDEMLTLFEMAGALAAQTSIPELVACSPNTCDGWCPLHSLSYTPMTRIPTT